MGSKYQSKLVSLNLYIVVLFVLLHGRWCLRASNDPFVVDYGEYYYKDLRGKLAESMSINNCSLNGHGLSITRPWDGDSVEYDMSVEIVHPNDVVKNARGTLGKEKHIDDTKLFIQVSPSLCKSKAWGKFKKRESFRGSRGCADRFTIVDGKRVKVVNKKASTLHPGHIRCEVDAALTACVSGSTSPMVVRRKDRELRNYPFAISTNKGTLVASSGHLVNTCGVFGLFASCEAARVGIPPAVDVVSEVENCQKAHAADRSLVPVAENYPCKYPRIDRVFVMSQFDDIRFDRFLTESLPRMVYHLDYVLSNYNVAIHYGFPVTTEKISPQVRAYLDWLGITPRLVNGTVYADEAYVPREGGCQDASYNAWEIINQRETLVKYSTNKPFKKPIHNDIVKRFSAFQFEAESGKPFVIVVRQGLYQFEDELTSKIYSHVSSSLPQYEVRLFPSLNATVQYCPPCHIRLFARAAVVIGLPGADLSHIMFMKPGGMVVESLFTSQFDPKLAPVVGINARLSAVAGLHMYTFATETDRINPDAFLKEIFGFHDKVTLWH